MGVGSDVVRAYLLTLHMIFNADGWHCIMQTSPIILHVIHNEHERIFPNITEAGGSFRCTTQPPAGTLVIEAPHVCTALFHGNEKLMKRIIITLYIFTSWCYVQEFHASLSSLSSSITHFIHQIHSDALVRSMYQKQLFMFFVLYCCH